jgi:lower collar protein
MVGADHVGLSDYPIFDEQYREFLNAKIIDHYYYREIGLETVDMFIRQLRTKMWEIMPYYNKWYLAEDRMADIDPLSTQDMHSRGSANSHASSSMKQKHGEKASNLTKSESRSKARTVDSETPQTMLAGNRDYATAARDNHSSGDGTNDVKSSGPPGGGGGRGRMMSSPAARRRRVQTVRIPRAVATNRTRGGTRGTPRLSSMRGGLLSPTLI